MAKKKYYDSADATAETFDLKNGETAFARGTQITGTADIYVSGTTLYVPEGGWITVHEVIPND